MLSSLNVASVRELLADWWPVFIIAAGAVQAVDRRRGDWWPWLIVVIGVGLLLNTTDVLHFNLWQVFWPAIIMLLGLGLIIGNRGSNNTTTRSEDDVTAIMSGSETTNTSQDFTGARVTSIMGGIKLDLTKAKIAKEATIDLSVIMGGCELVLPENLTVKSRAVSIMGGIEDKVVPKEAKSAPVLYLTGTVFMGGVEIKRR